MSKDQNPAETSRMDLAGRLPDVRWGLLPILLVPVVISFWPQSAVLVSKQQDSEALIVTDIPDYYLRDAKMSALDDHGRLLYQVRSNELLHYPDDSATASQLEMEYFGPQGRWQLNAPRGAIQGGRNEVLLSGGVVAHGRSNPRQPQTTMRMDTARVLPGEMQLDTDDPVRIDDPSRRVRATGMTMDIDKDVVKLKKNVRVHHDP